MINKLKENLTIKIISIVSAFIVWLVIINITKPIVTGFVNIPISLVNEDIVYSMNKTYTVKDSAICRVSFKVSADQLSKIRQSDFIAYVDLTDLQNTDKLPIHVEAQNGIDSFSSNIQVHPKTLHVEINDVTRNEFSVNYNIKGTLDEGHSVGNVILSPNVVYVTGTLDKIQSIKSITIDIPVNNQEETFSGVAKARIIGNDGKEISTDGAGLVLSTNEINYSVVIFSKAKLPIIPVVDGNPPLGFLYKGYEVTPDKLIIEGPRSVIEKMYSIDLPVIDLSNLRQTTLFEWRTAVVLPMGIRTDTADKISVNIIISDADENILNMPEEKKGPSVIGNDLEESIDDTTFESIEQQTEK